MSKAIENFTAQAETYIRNLVPYVARLVASVLPDGMADADGIESGIIYHFGNVSGFWASKVSDRKWYTIAHRGASGWTTKRTQATVWLNPAIGNAEQAVRAMLDASVVAVFGDPAELDKAAKAAVAESLSAVGILKSGKLSAKVASDVATLAEKLGPFPVAPITKKTRTRTASGQRRVTMVCPNSCTAKLERRKDPEPIKAYCSRGMTDWVRFECRHCGEDLIPAKEKSELDKAAKNKTVTETIDVPEAK
jgi:hypothetical protein